MAITRNGVALCKRPGQFLYTTYWSAALFCHRWQWDYRDRRGILHSGISHSLDGARRAAAFASGEKLR